MVVESTVAVVAVAPAVLSPVLAQSVRNGCDVGNWKGLPSFGALFRGMVAAIGDAERATRVETSDCTDDCVAIFDGNSGAEDGIFPSDLITSFDDPAQTEALTELDAEAETSGSLA